MCCVLKANIMSVRAAGWSTIPYIQKKGGLIYTLLNLFIFNYLSIS